MYSQDEVAQHVRHEVHGIARSARKHVATNGRVKLPGGMTGAQSFEATTYKPSYTTKNLPANISRQWSF